MEARNTLQEATNAVFDDARALRLQKKMSGTQPPIPQLQRQRMDNLQYKKSPPNKSNKNDTPIPQKKTRHRRRLFTHLCHQDSRKMNWPQSTRSSRLRSHFGQNASFSQREKI